MNDNSMVLIHWIFHKCQCFSVISTYYVDVDIYIVCVIVFGFCKFCINPILFGCGDMDAFHGFVFENRHDYCITNYDRVPKSHGIFVFICLPNDAKQYCDTACSIVLNCSGRDLKQC